jgi:hypothetical protein
MGLTRSTVPFLAVVAIAAVIATPRASNAQIMDPGTPPRSGAVAISPSLESALPAPSSHFDGFLALRTNQLQMAAARWLSNTSLSAVKARPTRAALRPRVTR